MTQPEQAVGGATSDEPIIAAEPTIEDRFGALIDEPDERPEGEQPQGSESEGDPELEAEDIGDDDLPPIQAPVSWPDEDKAAFAELPRHLQERVHAREAEREKFVQAKSREVAQTRQQVEQQAVTVIKAVQDATIQQIASLLPEIPGEPSAHLLTTDPTAYAEAVDYRNYVLGLYQQAQQTIGEISQQQQTVEQQRIAQAQQASVELLAQEFPEFLDEATRPEQVKMISSTGTALGYSQDQLNAADGQDILAIRKAAEWKAKADRYDSLMAKRMEKVREAKALPRVSRPGAAQPKGAVANQRYMADREAMRRGDNDAAARVFERFL